MRVLLAVMAAFCCGSTGAFATSDAQVSVKNGNTSPVMAKTVQFSDLFVRSPLMLWGINSEQSINFTCSKDWIPQPGSVMTFTVNHSPALLTDKSYMSVQLNGSTLKTFRLDESNIQGKEFTVALPPNLLKDHNKVTFLAGQHYKFDCEDPFSPLLWSQIGTDGRLLLISKRRAPLLDLHNWPYPVVDPLAIGKRKVNFIMPERPSAQTSSAMATIGQALGATTRSGEVDLAYGFEVNGGNILVGTPEENETLAKLATRLPIPLRWGKFVDRSGRPLPADSGVLQLVPAQEGAYGVILVVSGNSPEGVVQAARALTEEDFSAVLSGQASVVSKLPSPGKRSKDRRPLNLVPAAQRFTLKDLGYRTTSARGVEPSPLVIEANTPPGIRLLGPEQRLNVVFGYGAQMNTDVSTLEVRFNGVTLASFPLDKKEGEQRRQELVKIPDGLIGTRNKLEFAFHMFSKHVDRCAPYPTWHLFGTLYDDTYVELDREYVTDLPDLALLNMGGLPFTGQGSLQETSFVLPAKASPDVLMGLLKVCYQFGQFIGSVDAPVGVCYDDNIPESVRSSKNLIVLSPGHGNAVEQQLTALRGPLLPGQMRTGAEAQAANEKIALLSDSSGLLGEWLSPWAPGKAVLLCSGTSPEGFALSIQALIDPSIRKQLDGGISSVSPRLVVKSIKGPMTSISSINNPWRLAAVIMSNNPWLAPIIIVLFLPLGVWVVHEVKRRSKARVSGENKGK